MIVLMLAVLNAAVFHWIADGIFGGQIPILPEIVAAVAFLAVPLIVALISTPAVRPRRSASVDVPSMSGAARDAFNQGDVDECWSFDCNQMTEPGELICPLCRDKNRRQIERTEDLRRRGLL